MPGSASRAVQHPSRECIQYAGRSWPVEERLTISGLRYFVLRKTGTAERRRYMVFDPQAGPGGDLRALLILPRSRRAEQHVRVLKRLSSRQTHWPTILEYHRRGPDLVLVLPWVRGPDLQSFLDGVRNGFHVRPSASESVRLFRGLAHGLTQVHRRHTIIHGDIKPPNLILTRNPSRLVLIDFGSAWLVPRTAWRDEGDGISRGYAAPELQKGAAPDARSDQFSASVVLYELLTLKRPFGGLGGYAGANGWDKQLAESWIAPSHLSPDRGRLPSQWWRAVDALVSRGLQWSPEARFPTGQLWLDEIDRLAADLRLRGLSPTSGRLTRWLTWVTNYWNRR